MSAHPYRGKFFWFVSSCRYSCYRTSPRLFFAACVESSGESSGLDCSTHTANMGFCVLVWDASDWNV